MYNLEQEEQTLEIFEKELKALEEGLDSMQKRYMEQPNAALLVQMTEIKYDREQIMAEIKICRANIQECKESLGLDHEAEQYRKSLNLAHGKPEWEF